MTHVDRILKITLKGTAVLVILIISAFPAFTASTHSLDMYAQTQTIQNTNNGLQVDWKITPGPLLASTDWEQADQNQDGMVSQEEARAWLEPFLSQWTVSLDSKIVHDIRVTDVHWPAASDAFQSGEDPIEIRLTVRWLETLVGQHTIEIHNANQEAISLNWYSVESKGGISFLTPSQSNGLLDLQVNYGGGTITGGGNKDSSLTSWDSGQPNLGGVTGALANLAGNLANSANAQLPTAGLTGPTAALARLVRTQNFSFLFLAGAFLLSLALGSLHALTPGHGKTLVAAYLVGSHGKARDAVFLGSIVTLTHTGSVLIFGLLTQLASHFIFPTLITPWLEIVSGLAVVGFGLSLLVTRWRSFYAWYSDERREKALHRFRNLRLAAGAQAAANGHSHSHIHNAEFHLHDHYFEEHHHMPEYSHEGSGNEHPHPPIHPSTAEEVTWKSLLTLGISGGMVPCPDAIAILAVAVALGRIPLGMLLIVAFSLGLALVLIGIGIATVQGSRLLQRNDWLNHFSLYTPIASAVVVLGLGIGLSLSSFNALKLSSNALHNNQQVISNGASQRKATGPAFDIRTAKLIYLSQDSQGMYQLTESGLSGNNPVVFTQEPNGVDGYSLSPDRQGILYTTLRMDGGSSIWAIRADGTQNRLVLDCPQAQCEQPVWYPDGQKVVYERLDESQSSMSSALPLFSIWWLDITTGETKPVFEDQAFPALAPAFSPDGQWLSYISPATNTLQVCDLIQSRTISVPLSNQSYAQQLWSPVGDSLLYWEPATPQPDAAIHVKKYSLASGQKVDLGGSVHQADYTAVWSPDGQWVAINRDGSNSTSSSTGEQIWLVRPDGTRGHALLDDTDAYSDFSWSPDSRYLIFDRTPILGDEKPETWLADIRSGTLSKIMVGGILPSLLP
jgi:nickel/cobalt exporter